MNTPNNNAPPAPAAIKPPVAAIPTAGIVEAIQEFAVDAKHGFCEVQARTIVYFAEYVAKKSFLDAAAASIAWRDASKALYEGTMDTKTFKSPLTMDDKHSEHTLAVVAFGTMPREFAETVMRIHARFPPWAPEQPRFAKLFDEPRSAGFVGKR